jgi:hypothetical protein
LQEQQQQERLFRRVVQEAESRYGSRAERFSEKTIRIKFELTHKITIAESANNGADARNCLTNAHTCISYMGWKKFISIDIDNSVRCGNQKF